MTFAEKLTKLRRAQNYTQEQFADLLCVSRQAVSRWESGTAYPETDKLIRIGEMFDCSIDYLLKDSIEDMQEGMSPMPLPSEKPKKKKKHMVIAATVFSILVITLLTAAFFPRTATITIRSWYASDTEGEEYELTYKEIASTATYPFPEYYMSSNLYGTWNLNGSGYGNSAFAVVDTKNIGKGTIGSSVFFDGRFDKLYLYDNSSGMWRIFILDGYSDNAPAHIKVSLDKRNGEYYQYYVS